jgi:hypothetical protein
MEMQHGRGRDMHHEMNMQHGKEHGECPLSMLYVQVNAEFPCQYCMFKSTLHIQFRAAQT